MKVIRRRELRVNLGNFEHVVTTAEVEFEADVLGPGDPHIVAANELLDALIAQDLQDAKDASGNEDSFIFTWTENKEGK